MPLLWHSLSRGSVAPPPSPAGLFPGMEGIRGGQLCAEGPMCRRPKLRLKGQICFADWSSSLEKVLGKLLTPPVSTFAVIQDREQPLLPSPCPDIFSGFASFALPLGPASSTMLFPQLLPHRALRTIGLILLCLQVTTFLPTSYHHHVSAGIDSLLVSTSTLLTHSILVPPERAVFQAHESVFTDLSKPSTPGMC